jgi:hypothetical protein
MREYQWNYKQNHKKEISEYNKEYNEKNRQILKEKRNEKFICECGYNVSRRNAIKHKFSKRHIDAFLHRRCCKENCQRRSRKSGLLLTSPLPPI